MSVPSHESPTSGFGAGPPPPKPPPKPGPPVAAGNAYQAIAQSAAIAIQDAVDNLRNVGTISTTAVGVAMAELLATGDAKKYGPVIAQAQGIWTSAATSFQTVGVAVQTVLGEFNSSSGSSGSVSPSGKKKE